MNLWSNEVLTDSSASLPDNKNLVIRRMTGTRDVHVVYCADKKKSKHYRHYHEMLFYRLCWGIGRVTSQCMAFSCLFLICDKSASVLHSSRDPLINIYAYMDTHTHPFPTNHLQFFSDGLSYISAFRKAADTFHASAFPESRAAHWFHCCFPSSSSPTRLQSHKTHQRVVAVKAAVRKHETDRDC